MKTKEMVAIVDYGVGNLYSVSKAFSKIGVDSLITSDASLIMESSRLVLPGVGAFKHGMSKLKSTGLVPILKEYADTGRPFLGICLGAQLLLEESNEFGTTAGLGLIPGSVVEIPTESPTEARIRVPHIGWNNLVFSHDQQSTQKSILDSVQEGSMAYFVHSFMMNPIRTEDRLADVEYHGLTISAVISHKQISGTQFHPEKSGELGLKILRNFCES